MGRKKKVRGTLYPNASPRGKDVRVTTFEVKSQHLLARLGRTHQPRGKTGNVWLFTMILKERVPLIYAFVVDELKKPTTNRNPDLQRIIKEWRGVEWPRTRPSARQLTAYIMERAMGHAWEAWGLKRPYTEGDHDAFFRRYIHGHPGAIQAYRKALRMPQPQNKEEKALWKKHHIGHEIKCFLGRPGEAARKYNLLKPRLSYATIVSIVEED